MKFVFDPAEAVIVQLPATVNVTTPPEMVHAPATVKIGVIPELVPVTTDVATAAGVYVPLGRGDAGTADVNDDV